MKYALVTGGSRGIGRAICLQLAMDHDYHVLINYRSDSDAAEATLQQIKTAGGQASLFHADVSNHNQVMQAFKTFREHQPDAVIEVLVNNAGITRDSLFLWMTPGDWLAVMETNLGGFFHMTQAVLQEMILNRYGRIINIVSLSGAKGTPGQTNYAAAKGGVIAATRSLAQEVAKKKVTVNAVAPGFINTDMTAHLDEKTLRKHIPMNRFGTPEEVAHLVSFLASPKASYITGELIHINGGIHS